MIQKFVTVPVCRAVSVIIFLATVLAGASRVSAQDAPAQPQQSDSSQGVPQTAPQSAPAQPAPTQPAPAQQPQAQQPPAEQSSGQEPSDEELGHRKPKPHDYKKWNFNAGGGASLTNGTTKDFVRGGGLIGAAGFARNTSKYFGFRMDFQYDDLPLRNSALKIAQAPSATSYVLSFMFDPIINVPVTKQWSGYIVFGPSYYHRGGKLNSSTEKPGSACGSFWTWWGVCSAGTVSLSGKFLSSSEDEFGYNFGAGVARKIRPNIEIYGEVRYLHGTHARITTDLRPITLGVRW